MVPLNYRLPVEACSSSMIPAPLAGRTLTSCQIRPRTDCNVIAVARGDDLTINPDPHIPLPGNADLIIIGDAEGEHRFLSRFREG